MRKIFIGFLIGGILASIFFSNYKISIFYYRGTFKSDNKTMYIYKDSNKVNHIDDKKKSYEVVLIDLKSYINN